MAEFPVKVVVTWPQGMFKRARVVKWLPSFNSHSTSFNNFSFVIFLVVERLTPISHLHTTSSIELVWSWQTREKRGQLTQSSPGHLLRCQENKFAIFYTDCSLALTTRKWRREVINNVVTSISLPFLCYWGLFMLKRCCTCRVSFIFMYNFNITSACLTHIIYTIFTYITRVYFFID